MASLPDAENENIGIEIRLLDWADGEASASTTHHLPKQQINLETGILSSISIKVGEGKITKEKSVMTIEEVLDLLLHFDKFLVSKEEDQFEWSTSEPSVQMLKFCRGADVIHTELLLKLYGFPEGYTGNAVISIQFDTMEKSIKAFQKEIRQELLALLGHDTKLLDDLSKKLNDKIRTIREKGRSTYSLKKTG